MNSLILRKLPILFWTVKLRLGHKFFQFIRRFNIGNFWVLVLGCTSKFFPINKEISRFCSSWTSQFLLIHEKDENLGFFGVSLCCFSIFLQFTKQLINWRNWNPIETPQQYVTSAFSMKEKPSRTLFLIFEQSNTPAVP